jgi:hypothetical protein
MKLFHSPTRSARRKAGFTLTEVMIATATLVVVLGSVIACNLFGISMAARQHVYIGASDDAAKSVGTMMNDIRSATFMVVGNYANNVFTPTPSGSQQSGNALAISTNLTQPSGNFPWATSWTLYYIDTSSNFLMRSNYYGGITPGDVKVVSVEPLTNDVTHPVFTEIDHTGTPIITSQYLSPVSIYLSYTGLDNSQGNENNQGPHYMALQPGDMVDEYYLVATITPRCLL